MRRNERGGHGRAARGTLALLLSASLAHAAPPVLRDFQAVLPQLQPQQRALLQQRAEQWAGWDARQQAAFAARAAAWDALPPAQRVARREEYAAWRMLPAGERGQLRRAAQDWQALPPDRQQALRRQFEALDESERRGWLLGPSLGAHYVDLHPLLAQLPEAEHAPLLEVLRALSPQQRADVGVLVRRTPPQERAGLRRELLSTAAHNREQWIWQRLDR